MSTVTVYKADRVSEEGADYDVASQAALGTREIADRVYRRLSRKGQVVMNGEYAAAVMRELAKEELKGEDDES